MYPHPSRVQSWTKTKPQMRFQGLCLPGPISNLPPILPDITSNLPPSVPWSCDVTLVKFIRSQSRCIPVKKKKHKWVSTFCGFLGISQIYLWFYLISATSLLRSKSLKNYEGFKRTSLVLAAVIGRASFLLERWFSASSTQTPRSDQGWLFQSLWYESCL